MKLSNTPGARRLRAMRAQTVKHLYTVNNPTPTAGLPTWCGQQLPAEGHSAVFGAAHSTCRECRAARAARLPDLQQRWEDRKAKAKRLGAKLEGSAFPIGGPLAGVMRK